VIKGKSFGADFFGIASATYDQNAMKKGYFRYFDNLN